MADKDEEASSVDKEVTQDDDDVPLTEGDSKEGPSDEVKTSNTTARRAQKREKEVKAAAAASESSWGWGSVWSKATNIADSLADKVISAIDTVEETIAAKDEKRVDEEEDDEGDKGLLATRLREAQEEVTPTSTSGSQSQGTMPGVAVVSSLSSVKSMLSSVAKSVERNVETAVSTGGATLLDGLEKFGETTLAFVDQVNAATIDRPSEDPEYVDPSSENVQVELMAVGERFASFGSAFEFRQGKNHFEALQLQSNAVASKIRSAIIKLSDSQYQQVKDTFKIVEDHLQTDFDDDLDETLEADARKENFDKALSIADALPALENASKKLADTREEVLNALKTTTINDEAIDAAECEDEPTEEKPQGDEKKEVAAAAADDDVTDEDGSRDTMDATSAEPTTAASSENETPSTNTTGASEANSTTSQTSEAKEEGTEEAINSEDTPRSIPQQILDQGIDCQASIVSAYVEILRKLGEQLQVNHGIATPESTQDITVKVVESSAALVAELNQVTTEVTQRMQEAALNLSETDSAAADEYGVTIFLELESAVSVLKEARELLTPLLQNYLLATVAGSPRS